MNLTLTKPVKYEDAERWTIYICLDGLVNGELSVMAKDGKTPEEVIKNA